ncbi:hypothetical protein GYB57_08525 [bacterium]|nr:hypothetical protein [bacterium]
MKKAIIIFFILINLDTLLAQETIFEETVVKYNTEIAGGVIIHTNGFGANFRYGKFLTGFTQRLYQVDFVSWKNHREVKVYHYYYEDAKGYVFGKLNNLAFLRPSIGYHKSLYSKQSLSGVSINYTALVGPTIAFLKPVYLILGINSGNRGGSVPYDDFSTERATKEIYDQSNIYGRASFMQGIDKLKLEPGIHAKLGLNFEYANDKDVLKAIEVGLAADVFARKIPIMAYSENQQFFLSLSINLLYGVKKNE